jgi:ATP-dependent helicase/nuclease subunit A
MNDATHGLPPDQSERDRIVNDLDVNMMVIAGAGAGKTHALIERMVSFIRHGKDTVDRLAAITFTRKAAGEMKQRFHQRLALAALEAQGKEKDRLEAAKAHVDRCFIGTIHAFCSRLIRSRPIEAGVPIDFREIDEHEEPALQRRAWDTFLVERIAADDQTLLDLEDRGVEVEDLYDFFRRRVQFAELPLDWTSVWSSTRTRSPNFTASKARRIKLDS